MMKHLLPLALLLLCFNCKDAPKKGLDANAVIAKAIDVAGVKKLDTAILEFDFRDAHYKAVRADGAFSLQRRMFKEEDSIVDVLSDKGFKRFINDTEVAVIDSMATKYAASVNSVHYFAILPYGLDGKAVIKTKLADVKIKGTDYYKIKVTFNQDGGGEDFEDEFIYWVNAKSFKIAYLAYSYDEDKGRGFRFREAYNEHVVNGVRFVDYNNFKPKEGTAKLENLDVLFEENKLELLSKIELKTITIN